MFFWSKNCFEYFLDKKNLKIELILVYLALTAILLKQCYEFCFNLFVFEMLFPGAGFL